MKDQIKCGTKPSLNWTIGYNRLQKYQGIYLFIKNFTGLMYRMVLRYVDIALAVGLTGIFKESFFASHSSTHSSSSTTSLCRASR